MMTHLMACTVCCDFVAFVYMFFMGTKERLMVEHDSLEFSSFNDRHTEIVARVLCMILFINML